jgi:hypothetical protein
MKKLILTGILSWIVSGLTFAQWECPSQLAAYLKPVGKSNIYWSGELTGGTGYLTNNLIGNGMGLVGLDWSFGKSTIYAEGGIKYWNRYDLDASASTDNFHAGIRELYYQYKWQPATLTLGIQSARLDDDFLLNERIFGVNYKLSQGKWTMNLLGGSVTKDFARNGTFCNVGYLYDILPGRQRALIGNAFGQTNLAAATLKYQPHKTSGKAKTAAQENEFSASEFGGSLDPSMESKATSFKVESVGAVTYSEFGDWINQPFLTAGLFAQTEWGKGWSFKPEILFQSATDNNAIIYSLKLEKMFEGEHTRTNLNIRYLGKTNIDTNAKILNSFSNIFAGDVIRLDALDSPFIQAGIKHSFPKQKIHFKAQFANQFNDNEMCEFDLEAGKKFGKKLQVNLLSGYVRSNLLTDNALMGRIEFRYYF